MTKLPFEVWDLILSFNEYRDTKRVACTCRDHFNLLKPIIWRNVNILYPDCGLLKGEDQYLQNLQHTERITFLHDAPFEFDDEVIPKYSLYLGKFLSFFNRGKLREVQLDGVGPMSCFVFILESLSYIRVLTLDDIKFKDLSCLSCLQDLRSLTLQMCRLKDETFKSVQRITTLEELKVNSCKNLTDDSLACIGKMKSLNTLSFQYNGYKYVPKPAFKVEHLIGLTNLVDLCLSGVSCSDESFQLVCQRLEKLEEMTLQCLHELTNQGFICIHLLTKLMNLDIEQCDKLSERCFMCIEYVSSLRYLTFDAGMCKEETVEQAVKVHYDTIGRLNYISNLQTIRVRNGGGRIDSMGYRPARYIPSAQDDRALALILEVLCKASKWGLVMQFSDHNRVYVLHRSL